MKPQIRMLVALWLGLFGMVACRSTPREATWRDASALILDEGKFEPVLVEGEALREYLRGFTVDPRTGFRLVHQTRTGYMVIGDRRYRVTVAEEKVNGGRDLLTIHRGAEPLHLKQREAR